MKKCKLGHERPDNKPRCRECLSASIQRGRADWHAEQESRMKTITKKHSKPTPRSLVEIEPLTPLVERLPPLLKKDGYTRAEWDRLYGNKRNLTTTRK